MKFTAKVFKSGNSMALRLPSALKFESKELVVESGTDGEVFVYDPVLRERARQERRKRFDELLRNPPLGPDDEYERFEQ